MADKIRLMIVDDSAIIRHTIEKHLKDFNIEITASAADGATALESFKETNPDYVTLDITMPEMDGLTVLEEMLKIKPSVKVMIVTALSDKATGLRAIELGAKSFVPKPFTPERLREAFEKLIKLS
ncbi:MAG: response regulator [Calditrichaceae bacterium]|nr:response regulator [Calditrichaceae bacterium]MBN2709573.1 response regulator [Calditrichaceae bacterium]